MMYNAKIERLFCALVLITCFLCSCGKKSTIPVQTPAETPSTPAVTTESESVPETPPQGQTAETEDSDTEQETYFAAYIGKTVGDVTRDLGAEYVVDNYEGSDMIGYPGNLWFLFGDTANEITDDIIIRQVISSGDRPAVYELAGSMTYPEIVKVVGGEAEVPPPERYYSEQDGDWTITTGFLYRGYSLMYTWLEDPEKTESASVYVTKLDVDSLAPVDATPDPAPAAPSDDTDEPQEFFRGPGWFEGVMGCKLYVPAGFVQKEDEALMRGMGTYTYSFQNDELDMQISVFECTLNFLPDAVAEEYRTDASKNGGHVTSGEKSQAAGGDSGKETVCYSQVDYDEDFYYSLTIEYPADNADACEEILSAFLEDYRAG